MVSFMSPSTNTRSMLGGGTTSPTNCSLINSSGPFNNRSQQQPPLQHNFDNATINCTKMTISADSNSAIVANDNLDVVQDQLHEASSLISVCHQLDVAQENVGDRLGVTRQPIFFEHGSLSGDDARDYVSLRAMGISLDDSDGDLRMVSNRAVPQELLDLQRASKHECRTGILPLVDRAWMSINHQLFVWNYVTGTDLATTDLPRESTPIQRVTIMRRPTGNHVEHMRLPEDIQYMLVVCTMDKCVLLAVTLVTSSTTSSDEMHVHPTPLAECSLDVDITHVTCVATNNDGRIFIGANDDCLYEIDWMTARSSWLPSLPSSSITRSCKIYNRTHTAVKRMAPLVLKQYFVSNDSLTQITIDERRRLLFTLSRKSTVQVYSLAQLSSCDYVTSLTIGGIGQTAMSMCPLVSPAHFARIVHIHAITNEHEQEIFSLVATTEAACRLYFTCATSVLAGQSASTLRLIHVRLPVGYQAQPLAPSPFGQMTHHSRFEDKMDFGRDQEADHVGLATLDALVIGNTDVHIMVSRHASDTMSGRAPPVDSLFTYGAHIAASPVEGRLTETHSHISLSGAGQVIGLSYAPEHRHIIVLTTSRIFTLAVQSRSDMLRQLLERNVAIDSNTMKTFVVHVCTPVLASTAAVQLACKLILPSEEDERSVGQDTAQQHHQLGAYCEQVDPVIAQCVRLSHIYAQSIDYTTSTLQPAMWNNAEQRGLQSTAHTIHLSSVVHALYAAAAEILTSRAMNTNVLTNGARGEAGRQTKINSLECAFTRVQLDAFVERLKHLRAYIIRCFLNMDWLYAYVTRGVQVLRMWSIVSTEHDIGLLLSAHMPPAIRECIARLSLSSWITTVEGYDMCRDVLTCLMKEYTCASGDTSYICDQLKMACPSLWTQHDAMVAKATELLSNASHNEDTVCDRAVQLLLPIVQHVQLTPICRLLAKAHHYSGIVTLCVHAARQCKGTMFSNVLRGARAGEVVGQQGANRTSLHDVNGQRREEIYSIITCTLDSLRPLADSSMLTSMLADVFLVDEPQLHHVVFGWLIDNNLHDVLLGCQSTHLQTYLEEEARTLTTPITVQHLLIRHYERTRQHVKAYEVCVRCAEQPGTTLPLIDRCALLSRAIVSARTSAASSDVLAELHDKSEVASLQARVQRALQDALAQTTNQRHAQVLGQAGHSLDAQLYDTSTLYAEYAEKYHLYECQLAIVVCAAFADQALINELYTNIIDYELGRARDYGSASIAERLIAKLLHITDEHRPMDGGAGGRDNHVAYVPIPFIVGEFLVRAYERKFEREGVLRLCNALNVDMDTLLCRLRLMSTQSMALPDRHNRQAFLVDVLILALENAVQTGVHLPATGLDMSAYFQLQLQSQPLTHGVQEKIQLLSTLHALLDK